MEVKIDEDGTMLLKGSHIAIIIWITIIAIKIYGKNVLGSIGFEINLLTSIFLMITLGAMISRYSIIYWKYAQFKKEIAVKSKITQIKEIWKATNNKLFEGLKRFSTKLF